MSCLELVSSCRLKQRVSACECVCVCRKRRRQTSVNRLLPALECTTTTTTTSPRCTTTRPSDEQEKKRRTTTVAAVRTTDYCSQKERSKLRAVQVRHAFILKHYFLCSTSTFFVVFCIFPPSPFFPLPDSSVACCCCCCPPALSTTFTTTTDDLSPLTVRSPSDALHGNRTCSGSATATATTAAALLHN